jgi:predicted metal-binding protein
MRQAMDEKYIVVVQCDIVMERCSGYFCEKAFHERTGGFSEYPKDKEYRTLYMTCGGCCGRAVMRKLNDLTRTIEKEEEVPKERIVVHLSSCITKDNYHAPPCPHLDYIKTLISDKLSLDIVEATHISRTSSKLRENGLYQIS